MIFNNHKVILILIAFCFSWIISNDTYAATGNTSIDKDWEEFPSIDMAPQAHNLLADLKYFRSDQKRKPAFTEENYTNEIRSSGICIRHQKKLPRGAFFIQIQTTPLQVLYYLQAQIYACIRWCDCRRYILLTIAYGW